MHVEYRIVYMFIDVVEVYQTVKIDGSGIVTTFSIKFQFFTSTLHELISGSACLGKDSFWSLLQGRLPTTTNFH